MHWNGTKQIDWITGENCCNCHDRQSWKMLASCVHFSWFFWDVLLGALATLGMIATIDIKELIVLLDLFDFIEWNWQNRWNLSILNWSSWQYAWSEGWKVEQEYTIQKSAEIVQHFRTQLSEEKWKWRMTKNCFRYRNIDMSFIDIGWLLGVWVGGILCKGDQRPHVFFIFQIKWNLQIKWIYHIWSNMELLEPNGKVW